MFIQLLSISLTILTVSRFYQRLFSGGSGTRMGGFRPPLSLKPLPVSPKVGRAYLNKFCLKRCPASALQPLSILKPGQIKFALPYRNQELNCIPYIIPKGTSMFYFFTFSPQYYISSDSGIKQQDIRHLSGTEMLHPI